MQDNLEEEEKPKPIAEEKEPTPRLFIKKIVCENFKSYYGVKEIGPFHKVKKTLLFSRCFWFFLTPR